MQEITSLKTKPSGEPVEVPIVHGLGAVDDKGGCM